MLRSSPRVVASSGRHAEQLPAGYRRIANGSGSRLLPLAEAHRFVSPLFASSMHPISQKSNSRKFAPGFGIRHHTYGGKLTRRGSGGKETSTTNLERLRARRIRAGAVALVLSGLALVPVPFLQNVPTNPEQNVAFALGANTLAWRLAWSSLSSTSPYWCWAPSPSTRT